MGEPARQLSRERVLRAAVGIADARGLGALTMRSLAAELDAKPMSLYHYIRNKDALLDALVDGVFAEIELPGEGDDWRAEVRRRSLSARAVLARHPWALALVETRTSPGPATLRHHDAMLGVLRAGGFSLSMTAHAYAIIDAYVFGFVLQEASLPFDGPDSANAVTDSIMEGVAAGDYPHLVEFATQHVQQPGYHFGGQFEFGLDLILDALAVHVDGARPS
ncbi:TetR family transcriptional regulator [Micromonospora sp. ATCC 39149]|uniref:TetR/AcrR family transcriptional regulator n=1 Tax=Micromonospora sp. (strain ATCC 39149 / NRRL 15099 / SCC 1413) TaxID=219305 RepID=UPI0001A512FE|nr:TetR/AcrR family transcriptional regulator [Micromonospora sp. ATCC 39149]EEP70289.1 TetR family transcriptional regulator [Micromonospora sp. ATCC 39149]